MAPIIYDNAGKTNKSAKSDRMTSARPRAALIVLLSVGDIYGGNDDGNKMAEFRNSARTGGRRAWGSADAIRNIGRVIECEPAQPYNFIGP